MAKKKNIFIIDSNTIDFKYLPRWQKNLKMSIDEYIIKNKEKFDVVTIYNNIFNTHIMNNDTPLTYLDIIEQQTIVTNTLIDLIKNNKIKQGDHFIFMDAWNPAILQLQYLSVSLGIKFYIHGFWHKSVSNKTSYLYFTQNRTWLKNTERALVAAINYNYYDTEFHFSMMKDFLFKTLGMKRMINGQNKFTNCSAPLDHIHDISSDYNNVIKRNMILFTERGTLNRQLVNFRELKMAMPEYEFVYIFDRGITEEQYFGLLASAKAVISFDTIDSDYPFVYEALKFKTIPIVPNRLNFTELAHESFRYPSEWSDSYSSFIQHLDEFKEYINDKIENYELYKEKIAENINFLGNNKFNSKPLIENIFINSLN